MRHVDMKAALLTVVLNNTGSRVGFGYVSQPDAPSQSLFRLVAGRETAVPL